MRGAGRRGEGRKLRRATVRQSEKADRRGRAARGIHGLRDGGNGATGERGGGNVECQGAALRHIRHAVHRHGIRRRHSAGQGHLERHVPAVVCGIDLDGKQQRGINEGIGGGTDKGQRRCRAVRYSDLKALLAGAQAGIVIGRCHYHDSGAGHCAGGNNSSKGDRRAGGIGLQRRGPRSRARGPERGDGPIIGDRRTDLRRGTAQHRAPGGGNELLKRNDRWRVLLHRHAQFLERPFIAKAVDGDGAKDHGALRWQCERKIQDVLRGGSENIEVRREAHARIHVRRRQHRLQRYCRAGDRRGTVLQPQRSDDRPQRVERGKRRRARLVDEIIAGDVLHVADSGREYSVRQKLGRWQEHQ